MKESLALAGFDQVRPPVRPQPAHRRLRTRVRVSAGSWAHGCRDARRQIEKETGLAHASMMYLELRGWRTWCAKAATASWLICMDLMQTGKSGFWSDFAPSHAFAAEGATKSGWKLPPAFGARTARSPIEVGPVGYSALSAEHCFDQRD